MCSGLRSEVVGVSYWMAHSRSSKTRPSGWVNSTTPPPSAVKTACEKLVQCIVPRCGADPAEPGGVDCQGHRGEGLDALMPRSSSMRASMAASSSSVDVPENPPSMGYQGKTQSFSPLYKRSPE
jgi:hypothetical protein